MEYKSIEIACDSTFTDIIIAELSELGFDSFLEHDNGLEASCTTDLYNESLVKETFERYKDIFEFSYAEKEVSKINWNQEWEKNYDPITINNDIYVRATFHPSRKEEFTYEIVIDPKMSFGTGHHATTSMMLQNQLTLDHSQKKVWDAGTGTGILAIMAKMLGAQSVEANDIDEWCIENSKENFALNNYSDIQIHLGAVAELEFTPKANDIVLANINKNVLLLEMPQYAELCKENGYLVLSGFYESDLKDIEAKANEYGFKLINYKTQNNWCSPVFIKN
ncbi:MAG: 50S ribosomal protein L11 methyltransferase [Cytophagales bacterium]